MQSSLGETSYRKEWHTAMAKHRPQPQSPNVVWTQQETEGPRSTGGCVVNTFSDLNDFSWANKSTPLHEAMLEGQDIATLLIENGANINLLNALGRTALHEAAKDSRFDDASFLIRKGANVNAETQARIAKDSNWGQRIGVANLTPLHEAIGVGDERMVAILIEGGANVNHVSPEGWSPLDLALLDEQEQVIEVLLAHGAQFISPEKHVETKSIQNTNCREQRRLARQLLDCDELLPSSECRETYLDLLSKVDHSLIMEGTGSTDTRDSRLVSAFHTLLYKMAERRDPCKDPSNKTCSSCTDFQRQSSSLHGEPFLHYPDRDRLTNSVLAGCPLCILFANALDSGSDDPKDSDSRVMLRIACQSFGSDATRSIDVVCAGRKGKLNIYFLKGVLYLL
ncbi:hypothetical protein MMC11_001937 [Xylographa trunciseda]|nr:hypothetical protein [Xylographa trunciseda]